MTRRSAILGYVVLVVMLSAGAAQSLAGANTVTSDDIVDFSIVANDIKTAAIGGRPIVDNSITGTDVNESTLTLTCPAEAPLRAGFDLCYNEARTGKNFTPAAQDCADEGLRLPSLSEGLIISNDPGSGVASPGEWADGGGYDSSAYYGIIYTEAPSWDIFPTTGSLPYRCVTTVGARP